MPIFIREPHQKISTKKAYFNIVLVILLITILCCFSFYRLEYDFNWQGVLKYRAKFVNGFLMTIIISFFALFFSMILGTLVALARRSNVLFIHYLSKFFVELIRGTPLLVQILIFFYVIANSFNLENRYILGILILAVFSGAYVSEIIRAGIESIEQSQIETAKSLGFTKFQKYRYIIIPQVVKIIMPALAGQFMSLIKDSSLLSIISISELTMNAQEVSSYTYSTLESYILLAIGYLMLTLPLSLLTKFLERKYVYAA